MNNAEAAFGTVHEAWAAVMGDVRELGKHQRNNTPGASFNFRGIDDVMNAVGPVLRKHGVAVIPESVTTSHRDVTTSNGKPQREATVMVTYRIYGPAGDSMPGAAAGEAADSGDKGTPKAMSVAFRTFLLQALCLPTDEPDPDSQTFERAPEPTDAELVHQACEGIRKATDADTVSRIGAWARERGLLTHKVPPSIGQDMTLQEYGVQRIASLQQTAENTDPAADTAA